MKERPILFSGPMVRAILEGRKTQTRRVAKNSEHWGDGYGPDVIDGVPTWDYATNYDGEVQHNTQEDKPCPYGKPGDILYVKETWLPKIAHTCGTDGCDCCSVSVEYIADGTSLFFPDNEITPHWEIPVTALKGKNVPSIFMPRWASRILLEITDVRVERLHEISEEDAIAEGCICTAVVNAAGDDYTGLYAHEHFYELWDSIHGEGAWLKNPWVWVVEFRVIDGGDHG